MENNNNEGDDPLHQQQPGDTGGPGSGNYTWLDKNAFDFLSKDYFISIVLCNVCIEFL